MLEILFFKKMEDGLNFGCCFRISRASNIPFFTINPDRRILVTSDVLISRLF